MGQFVEKVEPYKEEQKYSSAALDFNSLKKEEYQGEDVNWMELRLAGKCPERRGYHSSFIHNRK